MLKKGFLLKDNVQTFDYLPQKALLIVLEKDLSLVQYNVNTNVEMARLKLESPCKKVSVSPDGMYLALLFKCQQKINIISLGELTLVGRIEESLQISDFQWTFDSSKLIVRSEMNLFLQIFDLQTQKIGQLLDCVNSPDSFKVSHSKQLLAVLMKTDNYYLEVLHLPSLESIAVQALDMKNPSNLFWGKDDLFLFVQEKLFDQKIQILLVNGATFMKFSSQDINFSIQEVYFGGEKAVFSSFTDELLIYSLRYFQEIKRFHVADLTKQKADIVKEEWKSDPKNALSKIVTMQKILMQSLAFKDYSIFLLLISPESSFFALVLSEHKNTLFIYDLSTYQVAYISQFHSGIKKMEWLQEELIVVTGEHCFFKWNGHKVMVMENFYKEEFQYKKIQLFPEDSKIFFHDQKNAKLLIFDDKQHAKPNLWRKEHLNSSEVMLTEEIHPFEEDSDLDIEDKNLKI